LGSLRTLLSEASLDKKVEDMSIDFEVAESLIEELTKLTVSGKIGWKIVTPFAVIHPTDGSEMVWTCRITASYCVALSSYNKLALLEGTWEKYTSHKRLDLIKKPGQPNHDTACYLRLTILTLKDAVLKRFPQDPGIDDQRFFRSLVAQSPLLKTRNLVLKKIKPSRNANFT
jgi:hypothetical protein